MRPTLRRKVCEEIVKANIPNVSGRHCAGSRGPKSCGGGLVWKRRGRNEARVHLGDDGATVTSSCRFFRRWRIGCQFTSLLRAKVLGSRMSADSLSGSSRCRGPLQKAGEL